MTLRVLRPAIVLAVASLAFVLASCGDDQRSASPPQTGSNIALKADPIAGNVTPQTIVGVFEASQDSLVFEDEFDANTGFQDSPAVDDRWCTRLPWGGGASLTGSVTGRDACSYWEGLDYLARNNELQRYSEGSVLGTPLHDLRADIPGAASVLRLNAVKVQNSTRRNSMTHAAGMIRSAVVFKPDANTDYLVSARLRIPHNPGTWPTFWLVPSTYESRQRSATPPELDIIEPYNNLAYAGSNCFDSAGNAVTDPNATGPVFMHGHSNTSSPVEINCAERQDWLESRLLWTNDHACFMYNQTTDPRDPTLAGFGNLAVVNASDVGLTLEGNPSLVCQPYNWNSNSATIIFNLAVGGNMGGDASSLGNAYFDVDWVRVHRKCRPGFRAPDAVTDAGAGFAGVTADGSTQERINNCVADTGTGGNHPPTVSSPGNQSSAIGASVSLPIIATDADSDPLIFAATGLPAGLIIDPATGEISGTVSGPDGDFAVTVSASDGQSQGTASFNWTIGNGGGGIVYCYGKSNKPAGCTPR